MSRASALLAALTNEPASTSELYDRVGYATLARIGLVPYEAFRSELVGLMAAGFATSDTRDDGATMWRLARPEDAPAGAPARTPPGTPAGGGSPRGVDASSSP